MNILDIILLLLLLTIGVITGLRKGFVYQIVTLVALFAGAYLAYCMASNLGDTLAEYLQWSQKVLNIISFVIIFLTVYAAVSLAGLLLKKLVSAVLGGWVDKLFGIIFSLTKTALVIGLIIMLFDALNGAFGFVRQEHLDESVMYIQIKNFTDVAFPFLKTLIAKGQLA